MNSKVLDINARNFDKRVDCGDGAVMTIIDPKSFEEGGLEWLSRYGSDDALREIRYIVAGILESYDYLISNAITQTEAIRRLKLMRKSREQK